MNLFWKFEVDKLPKIQFLGTDPFKFEYSSSQSLLLTDELVPEQEVSPVDGVEDEEEEWGEVEEEPIHLCILIIPGGDTFPCPFLRFCLTMCRWSLHNHWLIEQVM